MMLVSDIKSKILPLHFSYKVVFNNRGTEHAKFNITVIRDLIPGSLPVKLPFDNYNRPKFEQFMLLSASNNQIVVSDLLLVQTSPPTDLAIVFEIDDGTRFVPITMLIDDTNQIVKFYN